MFSLEIRNRVVLSFPGSSLPASSTVPSTSSRPQGAPGSSLADRASKPQHTDWLPDRLSSLRTGQVRKDVTHNDEANP